MGIRIFKISKSICDKTSTNDIVVNPVVRVAKERGNPDPRNYQIVKSQQIGEYLVVKINYPDCENYEGDKILLYSGVTLDKLTKQKIIDPHFSRNEKYHSPIARFKPTLHGWRMAVKLCEILK